MANDPRNPDDDLTADENVVAAGENDDFEDVDEFEDEEDQDDEEAVGE
jgi:hypothetical protein